MNTTTMILTVLVAFAVSALLGFPLIPYLRRLKFGQTILDIGPTWHKKKQGTPTMGGIMFVAGITLAVAVGYLTALTMDPTLASDSTGRLRLFGGMVMALAFGAVGFLDDDIKVIKKQNLGLTARQKYLMQLIIAVFYLVTLYLAGDRPTVVVLPFLGQFELGFLYYPLAVIIITGFVNAVNLTDGIDGLASSVTFVYALVMLVISGILRFEQAGLVSCALAGGTLGFLVWNFYPAKVFMGDTGSLFLSGLVIALCFGTGLPLFVLLIGVIYVVEMASVVIQMTYFKLTHGKRIFKMSPIHHHFELCGYTEVQIVTAFALTTAAGSALAIFAAILI